MRPIINATYSKDKEDCQCMGTSNRRRVSVPCTPTYSFSSSFSSHPVYPRDNYSPTSSGPPTPVVKSSYWSSTSRPSTPVKASSFDHSTICSRRRSKSYNPISSNPHSYKPARGEAEKRSAELTGREQIAEQTVLLKAINENLAGIRESTERNTTTNAALLVLLTHVLKGDPVENGAGAGEGAVYGGRTGAADAENHGRENSLLLDLVESKSFPSDVTDEIENGDHDE